MFGAVVIAAVAGCAVLVQAACPRCARTRLPLPCAGCALALRAESSRRSVTVTLCPLSMVPVPTFLAGTSFHCRVHAAASFDTTCTHARVACAVRGVSRVWV